MKKRSMVIIISITVCIFSWMIVSMNQPPKWEGSSSGGMWKTTFEDENSPKGFWNGFFTWNGVETITVTKVSLIRNDIEIHGWEKDETLAPKTSYNYLTTTRTFDNKHDNYILTIYWHDNEGQHRETIQLLPKTRYFVLPKF